MRFQEATNENVQEIDTRKQHTRKCSGNGNQKQKNTNMCRNCVLKTIHKFRCVGNGHRQLDKTHVQQMDPTNLEKPCPENAPTKQTLIANHVTLPKSHSAPPRVMRATLDNNKWPLSLQRCSAQRPQAVFFIG